MLDYGKPLFSLTVAEFILLLNNENSRMAENIAKNESKKEDSSSDITDIFWVMKETGLAKSSIRSMVCRGTLPVHKKNKPLLFSKSMIQQWQQLGRPTVAQMKAQEFLDKQKQGK